METSAKNLYIYTCINKLKFMSIYMYEYKGFERNHLNWAKNKIQHGKRVGE